MIDWQLAEELWNEPYEPQKEKEMVKRTYTKTYNEEPNSKEFDKPSEKEHLFQVVDIFTIEDEMGAKLSLDIDTVSIKCEVIGGTEAGRTLLQRLNLAEDGKGFFATRLFLKAIGEQYKGEGLEIDTDRWVGRQFYAKVVHNKGYANISEFNFEKKITQPTSFSSTPKATDPKEIVWNE